MKKQFFYSAIALPTIPQPFPNVIYNHLYLVGRFNDERTANFVLYLQMKAQNATSGMVITPRRPDHKDYKRAKKAWKKYPHYKRRYLIALCRRKGDGACWEIYKSRLYLNKAKKALKAVLKTNGDIIDSRILRDRDMRGQKDQRL